MYIKNDGTIILCLRTCAILHIIKIKMKTELKFSLWIIYLNFWFLNTYMLYYCSIESSLFKNMQHNFNIRYLEVIYHLTVVQLCLEALLSLFKHQVFWGLLRADLTTYYFVFLLAFCEIFLLYHNYLCNQSATQNCVVFRIRCFDIKLPFACAQWMF